MRGAVDAEGLDPCRLTLDSAIRAWHRGCQADDYLEPLSSNVCDYSVRVFALLGQCEMRSRPCLIRWLLIAAEFIGSDSTNFASSYASVLPLWRHLSDQVQLFCSSVFSKAMAQAFGGMPQHNSNECVELANSSLQA